MRMLTGRLVCDPLKCVYRLREARKLGGEGRREVF
jgi:hypothetical protein